MPEQDTVLVELDRADAVQPVQRALEHAGIRFGSGLIAGDAPRVVITVADRDLDRAQAAIARHVVPRAWDDDEDDDEDVDESIEDAVPSAFPWHPVLVCAGIVAIHVGIALALRAWPDLGNAVLRSGALGGIAMIEPWRFVTSLWLHSGPRHVLWNGVAMIVFAVPLIQQVGYWRTAAIYLGSGIGGGMTAVAFAPAGTFVIGSSGAVAGLFGAWAVMKWAAAGSGSLAWRIRIRAAGIGLLVLPSLLTPETPDGRAISVESHVGGFVTGMVVGAVIAFGLIGRLRGEPIE